MALNTYTYWRLMCVCYPVKLKSFHPHRCAICVLFSKSLELI
uniref:Uncharacterized protein n=1 Tax=Rhizophora mucronata TaxID=61149 RepID=A0A2P2J327_RHIMU